MENNSWKKVYPYTLDRPLIDAINISLAEDDNETVRALWNIFVSYRKSTVEELDGVWNSLTENEFDKR